MNRIVGDPPRAALDGVLPDRRELALVAMERTRMPMVISDSRRPDNPIVLANQAFLDLTGYSTEEVLGQNCRFLQGPETAPDAVEEIRRGLAADEHFVRVELLNYRKDGSKFWNQLSISPVHDDEGTTIYHFASQEDVSARRRANELEIIERLLLMEVDHRTMNALAQVQSIISLTPADDVGRYSKAVRDRIDAIARVHRILSRSSWTGTGLDKLMEGETTGANIVIHGPSTRLSPRLAQPIAMVLHELITNARQHGALEGNGGMVEVTWDTPPDQLVLHWQEHGGARPTEDPRAALGLSLVRSIVERQLGGQLTMTWAKDGLSADFLIPARGDDFYS